MKQIVITIISCLLFLFMGLNIDTILKQTENPEVQIQQEVELKDTGIDEDGDYRIVSPRSENVLQVKEGSYKPGAEIVLGARDDKNNQVLEIEFNSEWETGKSRELLSVKHSTLVLGVDNGHVVQLKNTPGVGPFWKILRSPKLGYLFATEEGYCLYEDSSGSLIAKDITEAISDPNAYFELEMVEDTYSTPAVAVISDGKYSVWNNFSGRVLEVPDSKDDLSLKLDILDWQGGANQGFFINNREDGTCYITTELNPENRYVTALEDENGNIGQYSHTGKPNQLWKIVEVADGYYSLEVQSTKKVLHIGGDGENGSLLELQPYDDSSGQQWRFLFK